MRLSGSWLPRAALLSAALLVLLTGIVNPEAWVAQRNVDRYQATGRLDPYYLSSLGADATPVIVAGLPHELATCVRAGQPTPPSGLLGWNLGRARAADLAEAQRGTTGVPDCGAVLSSVASSG